VRIADCEIVRLLLFPGEEEEEEEEEEQGRKEEIKNEGRRAKNVKKV
jgi:hypothetical protein